MCTANMLYSLNLTNLLSDGLLIYNGLTDIFSISYICLLVVDMSVEEVAKREEHNNPEPVDDDKDVPDGRWGWCVVAGGLLLHILCSTYSYLFSIMFSV